MNTTIKGSWMAGLLAILLCVPYAVHAAEFRAGEQQVISGSEKLTQNVYVAGATVTAAGAVVGDLVGAGGTVLMNGPVTGDVMVAGGNINVLAPVMGDVRVVGGNITVQGPISGDLLAGGGQAIIAAPTIGGDVALGAGTVLLSSSVTGNVRIAGGDVVIDGPIAGNLMVKAEKVTLTKNARVGGAFTYSARAQATIEDGAVVTGETVFSPLPEVATVPKGAVAGLAIAGAVMRALMQLTGALILALFFRRYAERLVTITTNSPSASLGSGFVTLVVWPVASIVLLVSMIGVPLGIIGLLGYAIVLITAWLFAPVVLGSFVYRTVFKAPVYEVSWQAIALGVAVLTVLCLIPVVGTLVHFGVLLLTLGAMTSIKRTAIEQWR